MLKLFFGRHSLFVRLVEVIALGLAVASIQNIFSRNDGSWNDTLYWLLLGQWLLVLGCYFFPWYLGHRKKYPTPRGELGIEVHFLKSRVPASYIVALASLLFFLEIGSIAVIIANVFFMPIVAVNFILIGFHLCDRDPLPTNYYTHNWHQKETGHE